MRGVFAVTTQAGSDTLAGWLFLLALLALAATQGPRVIRALRSHGSGEADDEEAFEAEPSGSEPERVTRPAVPALERTAAAPGVATAEQQAGQAETAAPAPSVDAAGPREPKTDEVGWVTVARCDFVPMAHVVRGNLEQEGIPVSLADEQIVALAWHVSTAVGGVKVRVPARYAARARGVVREMSGVELESERSPQSPEPMREQAARGHAERAAGAPHCAPGDSEPAGRGALDGDVVSRRAFGAAFLGIGAVSAVSLAFQMGETAPPWGAMLEVPVPALASAAVVLSILPLYSVWLVGRLLLARGSVAWSAVGRVAAALVLDAATLSCLLVAWKIVRGGVPIPL